MEHVKKQVIIDYQMLNYISSEGVDRRFVEAMLHIFTKVGVHQVLEISKFIYDMSQKLKNGSNFSDCVPFFKEMIQLSYFWRYTQIVEKFSFQLMNIRDPRFGKFLMDKKFNKMVETMIEVEDIYKKYPESECREVFRDVLKGGGSRDNEDNDSNIKKVVINGNDIESTNGKIQTQDEGMDELSEDTDSLDAPMGERQILSQCINITKRGDDLPCKVCSLHNAVEKEVDEGRVSRGIDDRESNKNLLLNSLNQPKIQIEVSNEDKEKIIEDMDPMRAKIANEISKKRKREILNDGGSIDGLVDIFDNTPLVVGGDNHSIVELLPHEARLYDIDGRILKRRRVCFTPGGPVNASAKILSHDIGVKEHSRNKRPQVLSIDCKILNEDGLPKKQNEQLNYNVERMIIDTVKPDLTHYDNYMSVMRRDDTGDHGVFVYSKGLYYNADYPGGITHEEFQKWSTDNYSYVIRKKEDILSELFNNEKLLILDVESFMISVARHKSASMPIFMNLMSLTQSLRIVRKVTIKGNVYYVKEGLINLINYIVDRKVSLFLVSSVMTQNELEDIGTYMKELNRNLKFKGAYSFFLGGRGVLKYANEFVYTNENLDKLRMYAFFKSKIPDGSLAYIDVGSVGLFDLGRGYLLYSSYDCILSTFKEDVVYTDMKIVISSLKGTGHVS